MSGRGRENVRQEVKTHGRGGARRKQMKLKQLLKAAHRFAEPYCVTDGGKFRLKDVDPADTGDRKSVV